jgi:DNA-binding SARP family transcriptional activator
MRARRQNGRPRAKRLSICLFGNARFSYDGEPWRFSAPPRTLPLLAYLILRRGKVVTREAAAFALWPDDDESTARANFRRHLHYLRNALPAAAVDRPWIAFDGRATMRWNSDAATSVDVVEFERLSGDEASLAAAVDLYAGDLLETLADEWVIGDRERLRDLQMSNLIRLVAATRRDGETSLSLQLAQRLLAIDPWREDAVRQLMALRYALGDRAGALAEFERFAARLKTELNASPMPETRACYESLVRDAPVLQEPVAEVPTNDAPMRQALLPFVGREREIETLRVWWTRAARGSGNIGLVGGEAGIGKTRLLAELQRIAEAEGGRVLLGASRSGGDTAYRPIVEALTGAIPMIATLSIDGIWLAVAASLLPALSDRRLDVLAAPPVQAGQERARLFEAVFQILRGLAEQRPMLLVLENLHWSGPATVDLVDYLADRIAGTRILVVASYRDEDLLRAHPLRKLRRNLERSRPGARLTLSAIGIDAVEVLVAKLEKRFPLVRDSAALLHARSEGNPLFIAQLVASSAEQNDPEGWAKVVPLDLRAVVAQRLTRLADDTRSIVLMASVIGDAFDIELLRELTGWSDERVAAGFDELLDRHLIRDTGLRAGGDYTFSHHLIESAIYAEASQRDLKRRHERIGRTLEELYADRLDEFSLRIAEQYERSSRAERAASFYARAARAALSVFAYGDAIDCATRGLQLAAADRHKIELRLAREEALSRQGDAELRERDLDALERLAAEDSAIHREVLRRKVELYHITDRRADEEAAIAALATIEQQSGFESTRLQTPYLQARFLMVTSRCNEALVGCAAALAIARAHNDAAAQTQCLLLLADIRDRCAEFGEAERALLEARVLSAENGDPALQIAVLFMSIRLANWQNRYSDVRALATRMLDLADASGDRSRAASALNALGVAALYEFDVAEARRRFAEAVELFTSLRRPRNVIATRYNQVLLDARLGRLDDAIANARDIKAMAAEAGAQLFEESVSAMLAEALLRKGDIEAAYDVARRVLHTTRISNSRNRAPALFAVARCQAARNHLDSAVAGMREGLGLLNQADLRIYKADATATLAHFYLTAGLLAEARAATQAFVAVLSSDLARFEEPDALFWIAAQVCRASGDVSEARDHEQRAWSIFQERLVRIPDRPSRESYAALSFHRELTEAVRPGAVSGR